MAIPKIDVQPIGGSYALLSPVTGAIVLTNGFGLRILAGWQAGLDAGAIAAQIADTPADQPEAQEAIETVLSAWDQAGLLTPQVPDFPDPVAFRTVSGEVRLGGPGGTALCQIPDPILAEQIRTVMGHMRPRPGHSDHRLTAVPDADGFGIFRDEVAISGRIDLDAARFVLMREVAETACGAAQVAAVFHAGCVALNDQALVLCGDSGQGKSTLTFGLVAAGCAYLGDDHVPLHRDGARVMAFPTAAGVKPGAWNLPEITALQQKFGLTLHSPRVGVRYIPLHQAGGPTVGQPLPVRAIVIPQFSPDSPPELTRVPPEQALIQALRAGSRVSRSHKGDIAPLVKLLNDVPCYRLVYSSSDQSVPACLNLLSNPLP